MAAKKRKEGSKIARWAGTLIVPLGVIGVLAVNNSNREAREAEERAEQSERIKENLDASRKALDGIKQDQERRDPANWTSADLVGTWRSEPYSFENDWVSMRVMEATYSYSSDGRYQGEGTYFLDFPNDPEASGEYTETDQGTYRVSNGRITWRTSSHRVSPDPRYRSNPARWAAMNEVAANLEKNVADNPADDGRIISAGSTRITILFNYDDGSTQRVTSTRIR